MVTLFTTNGGDDALNRLHQRLTEARPGGALDPALVICPSAVVAVGVRRALGRRPGGIAGVRTTTISALVAELVRKDTTGTGFHLATNAEILVAIRAVLVAEPGAFESVAHHRSTDERLLAFHQDLLGVEPGPIALIGNQANGLSADAIRVITTAADNPGVGLVGHRLAQHFIELLSSVEPGAFGPIIVYQPEPVRPFEARILRALVERSDAELHLALTGWNEADQAYLDRLAGWGLGVAGTRPGVEVKPGAEVVEVSDPDEEVRTAIRWISEQAARGVNLADTAIVYGRAEPYASMIFEQLDAADLPFGGPGFRPLSASLSGRTLRRLLALATTGLNRQSVVTFLASSPIDDGTGREVPAARWDGLSRRAGVIDDAHWEIRLARLEQNVDDEELHAVGAMARFVADLRMRLTAPANLTWTGLARWADSLLGRYLLIDDSWPDDELVSHKRVLALLAELGRLDRVGQPVDLVGFETMVSLELASVVMPGRPLGYGIHVGPVASVTGLAFERVCIVGLVEGRFPRSSREDPLLTDGLRARAGLMEKGELAQVDVRLVALAVAGSRQPALLTTSRSDLRSSRSRVWPRILDPLVASKTVIESHYVGMADHGRPASLEAFELRSLIDHVRASHPVSTHQLAGTDPVLASALRRERSRHQPSIGPFTGLVGAGLVDPLRRPLSPTALETYAGCPRRYLFERVLRIGERQAPEQIADITPLDRGNLVHEVLEDFYAEMIANGEVPEPDERWSAAQRGVLFEKLEQRIKRAESVGLTGGRVRTALLHRQLVRWFDQFLDRDDEIRARYRSRPLSAEYGFGLDSDPPLSTWGGRQMRLRGSVDRVDLTADGGVLVIDYKTGKPDPYRTVERDPLNEGRRLQLVLYADAVAKGLGRDGPMTGLYWMLKSDEAFPIVIDQDLEAELQEVVGTTLDGIGQGLFPGISGPTESWKNSFVNCRNCAFERICPTDRLREFTMVRNDPALKPIQPIIEALDPGPEPAGRS